MTKLFFTAIIDFFIVTFASTKSLFLFVGKKRRLTFVECGNDINTMIDLAKVADLVSGGGCRTASPKERKCVPSLS